MVYKEHWLIPGIIFFHHFNIFKMQQENNNQIRAADLQDTQLAQIQALQNLLLSQNQNAHPITLPSESFRSLVAAIQAQIDALVEEIAGMTVKVDSLMEAEVEGLLVGDGGASI